MTFLTRKGDKRVFKVKPKGTSRQSLSRLQSQNKGRRRLLTREERGRMRTLENPLLYSNFVKKLEKLNPDTFDEQLIDRTLEPEEALLDIVRRHPEINIGAKEKSVTENFRDFLSDMGIDNPKVQNLVAMNKDPLTQDELNQLAYALTGRPDHAMAVDNALKAPVTNDVRRWMNAPNRYDIQTVDTPKKR